VPLALKQNYLPKHHVSPRQTGEAMAVRSIQVDYPGAGERPSLAQMVGHIDHDASLTTTRLAKQQHGFELERRLIVEQVLPPAARHNFWEDHHR
jgi:hypothetical protein